MKALRWHGPRDLRLTELIEPALETGEVRLRVAYCGICGSDLHEYHDGPHAIPVERPHPLSCAQAPITLGHEFCGTVVETASARLAVGMRVAVEPEYRCGTCEFCRTGRYNLCRFMGFVGLMGDGGMAQTVVVPEYTVHPLPDDVSFEQAAVFEPAAVALHAVRQARLRPGNACVVLGLGPIGLLLVAMLRRSGAGRIVAIDIAPARLEMAGRLGADVIVDARKQDTRSAVLRATDDEGAALTFEAAGTQTTLDAALACLRKGGRAVLVGLMGRASLDAFDFVNRELGLCSSVGYRNVYPTLIEWTASGQIDPSAIITRKVALEHAVPLGFDALLDDKSQIKVLVAPEGD
ncbi:MAG TPA: 2,3-butanediol dehydrogenase [Caldimonas sp.]|nr:2,3-butanediol dehydrogenase [Caldimonas sp.]HEX4233117.1 2,3-butanediol dehydrogenase [Caldimonas sp.]